MANFVCYFDKNLSIDKIKSTHWFGLLLKCTIHSNDEIVLKKFRNQHNGESRSIGHVSLSENSFQRIFCVMHRKLADMAEFECLQIIVVSNRNIIKCGHWLHHYECLISVSVFAFPHFRRAVEKSGSLSFEVVTLFMWIMLAQHSTSFKRIELYMQSLTKFYLSRIVY